MPTDMIEGVRWLLSEQAADGQLAAVPEGVLVTLEMLEGQASGTGGCNNYFTTYILDGASVTFGPIGSTLMVCEGAGGDVETAYLANLALVASWASTGPPDPQ